MASLINARCYIETSARTKHGINSVFSIIADEILRKPVSENRPYDNGDYQGFKSELYSLINHTQGPPSPTIARLARRYAQFSSDYHDPSGATSWRIQRELEPASPTAQESSQSRSRFFRRGA
jgi:hypothetical protein